MELEDGVKHYLADVFNSFHSGQSVNPVCNIGKKTKAKILFESLSLVVEAMSLHFFMHKEKLELEITVLTLY